MSVQLHQGHRFHDHRLYELYYLVSEALPKKFLMLSKNPESLTILIEIPKLEQQEMCSCIKVTDFMTADFMTLCKVVWSKSGRF